MENKTHCSSVHCIVSRPTSSTRPAKCIFTRALPDLYGPHFTCVQALLACSFRFYFVTPWYRTPWFSGNTRIRTSTNRDKWFRFKNTSVFKLSYHVSRCGTIKVEYTMVNCEAKRKEESKPLLLKPYTKKTEPNCYQLQKCYIRILNAIFNCDDRDWQWEIIASEELKLFVEL